MKRCTDCPAYRLRSDMPHGYCPLEHKQIRQGYIVVPDGDCSKPKTTAEAIELFEEIKRNARN
jgi:hypothetical protein